MKRLQRFTSVDFSGLQPAPIEQVVSTGDRSTSFGARGGAELYDRLRPSYPDLLIESVVDQILDSGTHGEVLRCLDVGAGTGIGALQLYQALVDRGVRVELTCLDPDPKMLAQLQKRFAKSGVPCPVIAVDRLERFTPEGGPFDVVTSFHAFHWVDIREMVGRWGQLLKPGGAVELIWNQGSWRHPTRDWATHENGGPFRNRDEALQAERTLESVRRALQNLHRTDTRFRELTGGRTFSDAVILIPHMTRTLRELRQVGKPGSLTGFNANDPVRRTYIDQFIEYTADEFADFIMTFSAYRTVQPRHRQTVRDAIRDVVAVALSQQTTSFGTRTEPSFFLPYRSVAFHYRSPAERLDGAATNSPIVG